LEEWSKPLITSSPISRSLPMQYHGTDEAAERVPADIFHGAGDVGTMIHNVREEIFSFRINNRFWPEDFQGFIPKTVAVKKTRRNIEWVKDIRAISAIAALEKFCIDYDYIPVVTEMMVYSHKWQTAGTLDDMGLMKIPVRRGIPGCVHETIEHPIITSCTARSVKPNGNGCLWCLI